MRDNSGKVIAGLGSSGGFYGLESKKMGDFFKSPIHNLSANLLGPLFAMGKNRAMLKAQKAAYDKPATDTSVLFCRLLLKVYNHLH